MAKNKESGAKSHPAKANTSRTSAAVVKGELIEDQLEQVSGGLQLDEVSFNYSKVDFSVPTDQGSHKSGGVKAQWDIRAAKE